MIDDSILHNSIWWKFIFWKFYMGIILKCIILYWRLPVLFFPQQHYLPFGALPPSLPLYNSILYYIIYPSLLLRGVDLVVSLCLFFYCLESYFFFIFLFLISYFLFLIVFIFLFYFVFLFFLFWSCFYFYLFYILSIIY